MQAVDKSGGGDSKQANMAANFVKTNVARVCEGKEVARLCGPALSGSSLIPSAHTDQTTNTTKDGDGS